MKKTFSFISLLSHNSFSTKEREKHYSSYVRRIDQIITAKRGQELGRIRRNLSFHKRNITEKFKQDVGNLCMFNKLIQISNRCSKSRPPPRLISNCKRKNARNEQIRIENERLFFSIEKTRSRANNTFHRPVKILRRGRFLLNKQPELPKVIQASLSNRRDSAN